MIILNKVAQIRTNRDFYKRNSKVMIILNKVAQTRTSRDFYERISKAICWWSKCYLGAMTTRVQILLISTRATAVTSLIPIFYSEYICSGCLDLKLNLRITLLNTRPTCSLKKYTFYEFTCFWNPHFSLYLCNHWSGHETFTKMSHLACCRITPSLNKKLGCFEKQYFWICFIKCWKGTLSGKPRTREVHSVTFID